jgi:hemerythrin-like domain-containing protein
VYKMRKMMPIGPLMIEHRLIEKMIAVMRKEITVMETEKRVRPAFIVIMADFIKFYADRCHHGKEEDILFRELGKKKISQEHRRIMNELIEEHKWGRKTTSSLVEAKGHYEKGNRESIKKIIDVLNSLVEFYPRHIEKEDKRFFRAVMEYFTQEERDTMLQEEFEFDQKLIHEKYKSIVVEAENQFS